MTKDLIDILQLSREEIDELIATAGDIIEHPDVYAHKCDGKKIATLFYEASTRTRLSFESAMIELGGNVIGFSSATDSSVSKGESVADTARTVECFADIDAPSERGRSLCGREQRRHPGHQRGRRRT